MIAGLELYLPLITGAKVEFKAGDVEGDRRHRDDRIAIVKSRLPRHRREEVDQGAMGDFDPLRCAGRSRREDDVGRRRRVRGDLRQCSCRAGRVDVAIDADDRDVLAGQSLCPVAIADHAGNARNLKGLRQAGLRMGRVERHIGMSRFHDRQQGDHHFKRPFGEKGDALARLRDGLLDLASQLVGSPFKLAIGHRLAVEFDGNRGRLLGRLLGKPREDECVAIVVGGHVVEALGKPGLFGRRQERQIVDRPGDVGCQRRNQCREMADPALDRAALEDLGDRKSVV